jgi:hypothetical protein
MTTDTGFVSGEVGHVGETSDLLPISGRCLMTSLASLLMLFGRVRKPRVIGWRFFLGRGSSRWPLLPCRTSPTRELVRATKEDQSYKGRHERWYGVAFHECGCRRGRLTWLLPDRQAAAFRPPRT